MSSPARHPHARAGRITRSLLGPVFACALALAFVGVPAAALAHHHADGAADDGRSCNLCLWQSHLAMEPAAAAVNSAPTVFALLPPAPACCAASTAPGVGGPRAPPVPTV